MKYHEVFGTLARYVNEALPLFADKWERFPEGQAKMELLGLLEKKIEFWKPIDETVFAELMKAKETIEERR